MKKAQVRQGIRPGNFKSLWTAVNKAKDVGTPDIPVNMSYRGVPVSSDGVADCFANFFDEKVKGLVQGITIDAEVQNGNQKPVMGDMNFMTRDRVYEF